MSVVTHLEQGLRADPRVSTVLALARALGVSVEELMAAPEAEPERPKRRRKGKGD
jgi:transcriptional regulator with XRE-family HTH domain